MARDRSRPRRRGEKGGSRRERGKRRGRLDFSDLDQDDDRSDDRFGDDDGYDDEDRAPRRRPGRRKPPRQERLTLMNLCTPLFGYAAILPQKAEDPQPAYKPLRDEVLASLKRIETEAAQHGIEATDATHACYALCFLMDTQVAGSEWNAKSEWATEPLGIVLQRDPEGGVNFFRRLEGFGDREKEVKEIYLVCLALGFRGKFAELEPTEQAARIGEVRQQLVRSIRPEPLEKLPELFPEAYRSAEPIEDEVPRPPGWWLFVSMGVVAVVLLVWIGLYLWSGRVPGPAIEALDSAMAERARPVAPPGPPPDAPASVEDAP